MRIGPAVIDTTNMTLDDLDLMIKELKKIRSRRIKAQESKAELSAIIADMKENGLSFCDKYTGEVLNADHFLIYDDKENCVLEGEWKP